jgi:hypothetical protein
MKREVYALSDTTKAMLSSWFNAFMAALLTAAIVVFTTNNGSIPLDGETWLGVLVSAVVAVLPVIKNYFSTAYTLYGKGS